jgi:hypothetical protein
VVHVGKVGRLHNHCQLILLHLGHWDAHHPLAKATFPTSAIKNPNVPITIPITPDPPFPTSFSSNLHTVAQKTVPMFCHFEQTCTNLTLTPTPAIEKTQVIVLHHIYNLVPYIPNLDKN